MNEGGLSPREHAEMRDLVLAGTQRIRPQGAHRAQFVGRRRRAGAGGRRGGRCDHDCRASSDSSATPRSRRRRPRGAADADADPDPDADGRRPTPSDP